MPVQSMPLVHWDGGGHVGGIAHAPTPVQNVSHWQESAHEMPPAQLLSPPHSTRQTPAPHEIGPWQLSAVGHSIRQLSAIEQSIAIGHAPAPSQSTLHGQPDGQTMTSGHELTSLQMILQTPVTSHSEHAAGHSGGVASDASELASGAPGFASGAPGAESGRAFASIVASSTTQNPPTQARPASQSS